LERRGAMNQAAMAELFSAAWPWLVLTLGLQRAASWCGLTLRGSRRLLWPGAIALAALLLPVGGLTIARWIAGLSANFSIPFTGLLAAAVFERVLARPILSQRDWDTGWIFGAIGGVLLYPFALGVGSVDPYEWGWRFSPLFVVAGALTAWLIWTENRFAILLLLAVAAFHSSVLESSNYWDYLLDPVYCLVSLVALGRRLNKT
jgi:hypothetical protein